MERTGEASLVCVSSAVHRHGYMPLSVRVQGRMLLGRAYKPFHHGSSGGHPVELDTIGVVEETGWEQNE